MSYNKYMGRILLGILLIGLGFLYDAITQVVDFCKGGYLDKLLWEKVWDSIVTFTFGFFIVIGVIYFIFKISR